MASSDITLEDVAEVLLREGLHVTALELNSELVRSKGRDLKPIRDFFSSSTSTTSSSKTRKTSSSANPSINDFEVVSSKTPTPPPMHVSSIPLASSSSHLTSPSKHSTTHSGSSFSVTGHKRSPSIQTFDSLDFARGSDDGVERSMDKIAVLEFELRKAKETIKSLRASLTIASTTEPPSVIVSGPSGLSGQQSKETSSSHGKNEAIPNLSQAVDVINHPERLEVANDDVNGRSRELTTVTDVGSEDGGETRCESLTHDLERMSSSDVSSLINQVKDVDTPLKPHEKKAINFLIHDFLMKNNLKMTAITLSDEEHDQDFESWFDVGLNLPPPPSLLHLYRFYLWSLTHSNQVKDEIKGTSSSPSTKTTRIGGEEEGGRELSIVENEEKQKRQLKIDCETQTTREIDPIRRRREDGDESERDNMQGRQEHSDTSYSFYPLDDNRRGQDGGIKSQESKGTQTDKLLSFVRKSTEDGSRLTEGKDGEDKKRLEWSPFQKLLLDESGLTLLSDTTFDIIDSHDGIIHLLAYDLPSIVRNHKEEHRSDLMPLLVSTIDAIRDQKMRDSLLTCLFEMISSPNDFERRMILSAFMSLARKLSEKTVEETLLPLIWEQINHQIRERRILVSEACVTLLPLVSSEIRGSLIFSIISQILLEDKDLVVKESGLRAMSVIMTIFAEEGSDDKLDTIFKQILPKLISDFNRTTERTESVNDPVVTSFRKTFIKYFIPSLCYWSLHTKGMTPLSNELIQMIQSVVSNPAYNELTALTLVSALESMVPFLFVSLINSMPSTGTPAAPSSQPSGTSMKSGESHRYCFISNKLLNMNLISRTSSVNPQITKFDQYISRDWFKPWNEWEDMFENVFLPTLINDIIPRVANDHKNLQSSMINFTSSFGQHFGLCVIRTKAKPLFLKMIYMKMNETMKKESSNGSGVLLLPCLAALLISIKPIQEEEKRDLTNCLSKTLINSTLDSSSTFSTSTPTIQSIEMTIEVLVTESHSESTRMDINQCILSFLQETCAHPDNHVKQYTCRVINSFLISNFKVNLSIVCFESLVEEVMKILENLSSNPDVDTRKLSIAPFGSLFILIHEQLMKMKGFSEESIKQRLEKITRRLNFFLEDPVNRDEHSIHLCLISLFSRVARNCSTAESLTITTSTFLEFSLPRMAAIAVQSRNNQALIRGKKQEIVLALLDAYTKVSFMPIGVNDQMIRESILPSLKMIREEVQDVAPEYEETVIALVTQFEKRMNHNESSGLESLLPKSISFQRLKKDSFASVTSSHPGTSSSHHPSPNLATTIANNPVISDFKTRFKGFLKK